MRKIWIGLATAALFAIAFCLPQPASAQAVGYKKPDNSFTLFLPDYSFTIGLWVQPTAIATGYAVFILQPNGAWQMDSLIDGGATDLNAAVAAAGGILPWIQSQLPKVNATLSARYPAVPSGGSGGGSTGSALADGINAVTVGSYILKLVNGAPSLAGK